MSSLGRTDTPQSPALVGVPEGGEPAAFAVGQDHRISFWNRGAERLFGLSDSEALGRSCHDIVRGRDTFGNRFCYENCALMATARTEDAVAACEVRVPGRLGATVRSQDRLLSLTTLRVRGRSTSSFTLVHVARPLAHERQGARSAGRVATERRPERFSPVPADGAPPLTRREREVLRWVALGMQNKQVARALGISLATVRNHVHSILDKLGVHSKLEAVCLAFRHGWVGDGHDPHSRAHPEAGYAPM